MLNATHICTLSKFPSSILMGAPRWYVHSTVRCAPGGSLRIQDASGVALPWLPPSLPGYLFSCHIIKSQNQHGIWSPSTFATAAPKGPHRPCQTVSKVKTPEMTQPICPRRWLMLTHHDARQLSQNIGLADSSSTSCICCISWLRSSVGAEIASASNYVSRKWRSAISPCTADSPCTQHRQKYIVMTFRVASSNFSVLV